jgi:hypothetical protein
MEKIEICNDHLYDLVRSKKTTLDNVYNELERLINKGYEIWFYNTTLDEEPSKKFSKLEDFQSWRIEKNKRSKWLDDLFTPKP